MRRFAQFCGHVEGPQLRVGEATGAVFVEGVLEVWGEWRTLISGCGKWERRFKDTVL